MDYRVVIEAATARLAATRRSERDVARLHELLADMDALMTSDDENVVPRFWRADHAFHSAIAAAAGNAYLAHCVEDGRVAMFRPLGMSLNRMREAANDGHAELVETITAGQPEAAAAAAAEHIEVTRRDLHTLTAPRP